MNDYFSKVKDFILDLSFTITHEDEENGVIVIENESEGIKNLVLALADPLLIVEQFIFELEDTHPDIYRKLLQKNRDIIHGAFVLDESGHRVIFRNTHELENLDMNELQATLNSLELLLSEYSEEIIELSKS